MVEEVKAFSFSCFLVCEQRQSKRTICARQRVSSSRVAEKRVVGNGWGKSKRESTRASPLEGASDVCKWYHCVRVEPCYHLNG
mmetsp:Transcript_12569/g.33506  ORF Transcript_12569/g.33506 Transcript_12569/m.33506 type:complete len:83 (+) Transcript_12569:661-909(+)